jgi:hypothetical protein
MKRGTDLTLKFKRLCRRLGWRTYQVKGLLQALWDFAVDNAVEGDIGKFSNEDICFGMDYEGNADEMIETLIAERWLDRNETHRLIIHDWIDHCEDWTKKKIIRRMEKLGYNSKEHDLNEFYHQVFCGETPVASKPFNPLPNPPPVFGEGTDPAPTENGGERQTSAENGGERQTSAENGGERQTSAENGGERQTSAENGGLPSLALPSLALPDPGPGLATSAAADSRAAPPPPEEGEIYKQFWRRLTDWNVKNGRTVPASTAEDTQSTQVALSALHRLEPMGDPYSTFIEVTDWIFGEDEYTAMRVRGMAWLAANMKWIYDRYQKALAEKEARKNVVPLEKQTFGYLKEGDGVNRSAMHSNHKQSARHAARV